MPNRIDSDENEDRETQVISPGTRPSNLDWNGFLYYLGYDLNIRSDAERLFKNFIYLEKERVKAEKNIVRWNAFVVTFLAAVITGVITVFGSYILKLTTH